MEDIDIYLKNKQQFTLRLTSNHTAERVAQLVAEQMKLPDIAQHIDIVEEMIGKGRKVFLLSLSYLLKNAYLHRMKDYL